jgi:hypothetical protein
MLRTSGFKDLCLSFVVDERGRVTGKTVAKLISWEDSQNYYLGMLGPMLTNRDYRPFDPEGK